MWRVTIKGLLAHKLRLALTALAIVLGVTFIAGTFVLTDTLHNTFNTLFGNIYQNIDFQVRGVAQFGSGGTATRNPVPESLVSTVRAVPGVEAAEGSVTGYAQYVAPTGKAITTGGAPTLGVSFDPNPQLSAAASDPGQPAHDAEPGRDGPRHRAEVPLQGGRAGSHPAARARRRPSPSAGLARFGTANNLAGATLAAFDTSTAQAVLGEVGKFDTINVVAQPGADKATVQRAIARCPAARRGGGDGSDGDQRGDERHQPGAGLLQHGAAGLRVHRAVRGRRSPSSTPSPSLWGSARASSRCCASWAPAGARSSVPCMLEAGDRRIGVVRHRPRARGAGRTRARSAAQRLRRDAALRPARLRSPDGHRLSRRRRGRDGGVGHQPGPPRRADRTGGRRVGPAERGGDLAAPPLHLGDRHHAGRRDRAGHRAHGTGHRPGRPRGGPDLRRGGPARPGGGPADVERDRSAAGPACSACRAGWAARTPCAARGARRRRRRHSWSAWRWSRPSPCSVPRCPGRPRAAWTTPSAPTSSSPRPTTRRAASATPWHRRRPPSTGSRPRRPSTRTSSRSRDALQNLTAVSTRDIADTVILNMTEGSSSTLADGQLLIDTNTANSKHLAAGDVVPVKFAKTGKTTMRIGGVFKANQLIGKYLVGDGFFLTHFSNSLPDRRPAQDRREPRRRAERHARAGLVPEPEDPDPGAVREVPAGVR